MTQRLYPGILGLCLLLTATPAARAQQTLKLNGKVASQKVRTVNGTAVVPLSDIAAALGMTVVKTANGYELIAAGGANQVEGRRGKIGDVLFDGKWRFSVQGMQKVSTYTLQTKTTVDYAATNAVAEQNGDAYQPKPGFAMYVLRCQVKNGQTTPQSLWWSQSM